MIQKPKKQLSDPHWFFSVILLAALSGLFLIPALFDTTLFFYLAVVQAALLVYLLSVRRQLVRGTAAIEINIQNADEQANLLEEQIRREKTVVEAFREKIIQLSQLKGLTEKLSSCLTLVDTSKILSDEAGRLFAEGDTTIILYLFHSKTGELGISSSHKGQMRVNLKSKKGDLFDQWVVRTMQPLLIEDKNTDYRFDADMVKPDEAREVSSLISAPMMVGNKALGILRVDSPVKGRFTTEDLRFLATIGDLGAVAIENAQLYQRVEQLAIKDGLTGLYLRHYLLERIPQEISRQLRRSSQFAFLMIDLDHFKRYNDQFGHMAGDIVLRVVGRLLAESFNEPGMLVCRYGGEEFSVLLPECGRQKAFSLAQDFRSKMMREIIPLRRERTQVTVSIGVAVFPQDAQDIIELIHKADLALYQAKASGRNKVCVAGEPQTF